ncbi:hypothetical protein ACRAWF_40250 [Streptomyces sp. L7]
MIAASAAPDRLTVGGSIFRMDTRFAYEGDPIDRVVPIICCPDGFPSRSDSSSTARRRPPRFQIDRSLPGAMEIPGLWRRAVDDMASCAPGGDR